MTTALASAQTWCIRFASFEGTGRSFGSGDLCVLVRQSDLTIHIADASIIKCRCIKSDKQRRVSRDVLFALSSFAGADMHLRLHEQAQLRQERRDLVLALDTFFKCALIF